MNFSLRMLLAAAGGALLALAGCNADPPAGSLGQLSTLRFEFSASVCGMSCGLDREVLVGSIVGIDVHNLRKVNFQVRSSAPEIVRFENTPRCRFLANDDCHEEVSAIAAAPGDANLEIYDAWTGTVLDRVTVHVAEAAILETMVRTIRGGTTLDLTPNEGVFELKVASDLEIVSLARSASGQELLATAGAIRGMYSDARILGPCVEGSCSAAPSSLDRDGRASGGEPGAREQARAKAAGATVVTLLTTHGVRHELPFRVTE